MNIDRQLRHALQRTFPPEGFSDRVLARLDEPRAGAEPRRQHQARIPSWILMAASFLLAVGGMSMMYRLTTGPELDPQGLRAKQQVMLALRIASRKTNLARERLVREAPVTVQGIVETQGAQR